MKPHTQTEPDTVNVSVLIVEDDPWQAAGIKNDLENSSSEQKLQLGINAFSVQVAKSLDEAMQLLALAKENPFDLLLLDLSLPKTEGEREEEREGGFKILDFVRTSGAAKEVLVISRFSQYDNVRRAFQGGALDFLAKPYKRDELQARVAECWKRVLAKESQKILKQRIQKLIPYDEKKLARGFSEQFSRFTQNVIDEAEEIERELGERFKLDVKRDRQDSLLRHLTTLREAVRTAKQEWTKAQAALSAADERSRVCSLAELLQQLKDELLPCLKVKNVVLSLLPGEQPRILSFEDDARAVLKEIVVGALAELQDFGNPTQINIAVTQTAEYAKVCFSGGPIRVRPQLAQAFKNGTPPRRGDFGQEWGLVIAQHIASRGGGRLQVGGDETHDGITYLIPLAHHD